MTLGEEKEWRMKASALLKSAWHVGNPALCDYAEGWTYSRILRFLHVDSSQILHCRVGWLVFPTRQALLEYCARVVSVVSFF